MEEFEGKIVSYVSGENVQRGVILRGNCYSINPQINNNGRSCVQLWPVMDYDKKSVKEVAPMQGLEQKVADSLSKGSFSVYVDLPIEILQNSFELKPLYIVCENDAFHGTSFHGNYYSIRKGSEDGRAQLKIIELKNIKETIIMQNPSELQSESIRALRENRIPRGGISRDFEVLLY